jgi:hypothetical protein
MLNGNRFVTIIVMSLPLLGCSAPDSEETTQDSGDGSIEWIDPALIQVGPILHEELSDDQTARIRFLQSVFFEVDGLSIDQRIDDFKRESDPDRELAIWERMANVYSAYCIDKNLTQSEKLDVYKVVLLRSMAPPDEVLANVGLVAITEDDAIEVMNGFLD